LGSGASVLVPETEAIPKTKTAYKPHSKPKTAKEIIRTNN
jgi:hypothetical protein